MSGRGAISLIACVSLASAVAHGQDRGWGFDIAGADRSARPGDGFFRYANGLWLDRTPIAPDKRSASVTWEVIDRTQARVRGILETEARRPSGRAPADTAGKIGAFYRAYMDQARIDRLGLAPIAPELDAVRGARTRDDLARLMGRAKESFQTTLLPIAIEPDWREPTRFGVFIGQPDLAMPDRGYYLDPKLDAPRRAFRGYARALLSAAGWADPDGAADRIVAFETAIAATNLSAAERRDWKALHNPVAAADLAAVAPGFPWRDYLAAAGLGSQQRLILREKPAVQKAAALFAATPVDTLKDWLAFGALSKAAPNLAAPVADAFFEFHDRALGGVTARPPRWRWALRAVAGGDYVSGDRYDRFGDMGWAVGEIYVARFFPPVAKTQIEDIARNVRAAYVGRLRRVDWMSDATRAEALRKLDKCRLKVGYPEDRRDYRTLVIRDDDLIGNVRRAAAFDWRYKRAELARGVSGREWAMTPQTVNAYYNPFLNEIVFPAGILQAPIFDPAADPAVNYGSIGMTIGHELTHGLDDQGRTVDSDGRLRDWWTAEDAQAFKARSGVLARQFAAYEALPGVMVDADLVLGEALADTVGLSVALDAYRASRAAPAPVIDGLSDDQRLFLGYAQYFRGKTRPEVIRAVIRSDPHPPREFRVDGAVRNLDGWYAAYGVRAGDRLYLPPDRRFRLW